MQTEFVHFKERHQRSEFVAKRFERYLTQRVADIGCFQAPLRTLLQNCDYVGVDMAGDPDIQLNLDCLKSLPFQDNEFNCVLCIEVLEHLDNLHLLFDELIRISQRYIIISLPNCWRDARRKIEKGSGDFLHYGLPVEKPADRHKWFFNCQQAENFFTYQADKHRLNIVEKFVTEKPKSLWIRAIRKLMYPGQKYNNRYANTVWVVYEKEQA
ncbi:methyltransferase domain-containing protein [Methylomarinum sp. Ch1-1]|uniref:Methyltransferase domain-containing protein n=1 Tax=Methylomarinum roseum TaxID=3067653 RepID=A0AAU7NWM5_9GAMM|nr:methyltransferase domain-containing protein [Methylomarinum sp. Ch1-1]MDP4522941.1 methyltransferase domain-containing protein [Methylomarinum sp. Ch1-1]